MTKSKLKPALLVMLSLTLFSTMTLAEIPSLNPAEVVDGCLTRDEKEKIVVCFQENALCHADLAKMVAPAKIESAWESYLLAAFAGVVSGMVLAQQVRH
jgi:hypothetical protein